MPPPYRTVVACAVVSCIGLTGCELGAVVGVEDTAVVPAGADPAQDDTADNGVLDPNSMEGIGAYDAGTLPPDNPLPPGEITSLPEVSNDPELDPVPPPEPEPEPDPQDPPEDPVQGCVQDAGESPCWFNDAWSHRTKVTIDRAQVAGSLAYFPVVVSAVRPEWRSTNYGGRAARADGSDFVFTANDATTALYHEVEEYDPATGRLTIWVKVPTLTVRADTVLYLYYGNGDAPAPPPTSQVWDDGGNQWFRGVWHMNESGSALRADASGFGNGCTPDGYEGDEQTAGKVGGADTLDGSDDWLTCGANASLEAQDAVTVAYWIRHHAPELDKEEWYNGPFKGGYSPYLYSPDGDTTVLGVYMRIDGKDKDLFDVGNAPIPAGSWVHVAVTYDGTNIRGYVNGQLDFTVNEPGRITDTEGEAMEIGPKEGKDGLFTRGGLDEIRVSTTARSAAWIATAYGNQNNPGSFSSLGEAVARNR